MKIGAKQILCVCTGAICFLLSWWMTGKEDLGGLGYLPRNTYGEGERDYELKVIGLTGEDLPIRVTVRERSYTKVEAEQVFSKVMETMGERVLGSNQSFGEVRSDLNLITWLPDVGVKLRWSPEDPDLVDSFGHIQETSLPKSGISTWLAVYLMTGEYSERYEIPIRIYPPDLTEQEEAGVGLMKEIQSLDWAQQTKGGLELPKEYEGNPLRYRENQEANSGIFLVLGVVLAGLFYARDKMVLERQRKKRSQKLLEDYSEIVFKLMIFIGAGMTAFSAWERVVLDYQERLRKGRTKLRPAYEEMYAALNQIACGVSEGQAYKNFGKRCQLQPYLKLSSLLEQNRKTGTKNLNKLLEAEMSHAWEQRKTMARRLGEEAGTKLLVPLFLMLGIVMVIIMVPAMMSMA